jgi:hypothetical protein
MQTSSRLLVIVIFTFLLLLPACAVQESIPQPDTPPAEDVSSTATPTPILATISPQTPQVTDSAAIESTATPALVSPETTGSRPRYRLTAILDYDQHYLLVDEQIHYTNRLPQEIPDLRLMVDPLYYPGVFTLKSMTWGDGQPVENFVVETGQISIPLPEALAPAESLALSINYELRLPSPSPSADVRPIPFGYTARQANFVDWYPFIPPYIPGTGWQAHQAGFFGEHLVYELADFEVSINLGSPQPTPAAGEQTTGSLQIAASAPAQADGEWVHFQHDAARNFAWSASRDYQVTSTTIGDTTILSYAVPYHEAAGEAVLRTTAESLKLYNEMYEPYPRQLLSVVEADFLDGMEYDGMYFLSNGFYNLYQGQPAEYLVAIAAHETAHQWFYAMVGNDQALEPWLDEALCTYHERIFYERLYPEALDWWWQYRINYYNPQGWVDGSIYNPQGYRAYRDAIYLNGAVFLEDLRDQIGDPAFFAFLTDYVNRSKNMIVTADGFFEILSLHTGQDLSLLIERYFQSQ